MADPKRNEWLFKIARQLQMSTQMVESQGLSQDALLTSADIARLFGINHDMVKKILKQLKDMELIQPTGISPKRFRFDHYRFKTLLREAHDEDTQSLLEQLQGDASPV